MRTLITAAVAAMLAIPAPARTPDNPDDISPAQIQNEALGQGPDPTPSVATTRPWLMQVTFSYPNEEPLLGGGIALPLAKTVRSPVGGLDPRLSRALKECPESQLASSSTVSSPPISFGSGALCLPTPRSVHSARLRPVTLATVSPVDDRLSDPVAAYFFDAGSSLSSRLAPRALR